MFRDAESSTDGCFSSLIDSSIGLLLIGCRFYCFSCGLAPEFALADWLLWFLILPSAFSIGCYSLVILPYSVALFICQVSSSQNTLLLTRGID